LPQRDEQLLHRLRRQHRRRLVEDQQLGRVISARTISTRWLLADRQRVHRPMRIDVEPVFTRYLDDAP
jgi:hypothetical protein